MRKITSLLGIALIVTLCLVAGTASAFAETNANAQQDVSPAMQETLETSGQEENIMPETAEVAVQENEPIRISLAPQEGFVLPETLILRIDSDEYTVYTGGENEPEGIAFAPETGILTIAAELVQDGDTIAIVGAAVPEAPVVTEDPAATETPAPTEEPAPTVVPEPTEEPAPTVVPEPTEGLPQVTEQTTEAGASDGSNA